ncbi:Mov34/MPN/PAD-1 family protein [Paenarthrobacter nicotinovorans]|uniref:Mov34/MPN/PAD-1 family protein n=1 Tax=Paenarthrobacter nicotinovorans TaxID=29320 RepID=UPI002486716B|nr:Mov34/MPN/PAD-1 family protein [Paenarthrobacter nicotinovorans]MDI2020029.1 hypothetical protein [Paenarthrobacter nicotinovorans]
MTTIWLSNSIATALLDHAENYAPLETGGILLGWRAPGNIHITHIIGPGPAAQHTKTSFTPDHDWQTEQIDRLYTDSGRRLAYLGDWHTHPKGSPIPSPQDLITLHTIAAHPQARCPQPLMLILGQPHTNQWAATAHLYTGKRTPTSHNLIPLRQ